MREQCESIRLSLQSRTGRASPEPAAGANDDSTLVDLPADPLDVNATCTQITQATLNKECGQATTDCRRVLLERRCRRLQLEGFSSIQVWQLKLDCEIRLGLAPVKTSNASGREKGLELNVESLHVHVEDPAGFWQMGTVYPPDSIEALLQRARQRVSVNPFAADVASWRSGAMR